MSTRLPWLPQFSLRTFLVAIAVLAIGLGGVLSASEAWAFAFAVIFHLLIPTAVVLAIVLTERSRAFWIGVVVFGAWCALFFADKADFIADRVNDDLTAMIGRYVSPRIADLHEARIASDADASLERQLSRIPPNRQASEAAQAPAYHRNARINVSNLATISVRRFLMLVISLAGGCLASWAYCLSKRTTRIQATKPDG